MKPEAIAAAFRLACRLDVAVRKPGNVSQHSPGHGMQARHFLASAEAAAPALCVPGRRVGARVEAAVEATWAVAGCNTNLGILLLAAPLAAAAEALAEGPDAATLRRALAAVLAGLDQEDAAAAFRAIARARPGGLGEAAEQDVREPPTLGLREAMALAAHRDRLAACYAQGGDELFTLGLPAWQAAGGRWPAPEAGVQAVYLAWLASGPDSHILRKHGPAAAQAVTAEAQPWQARAAAGEGLDADPAFAAWDASLKARGLNPGSSADLTVATLFMAALLAPPAGA